MSLSGGREVSFLRKSQHKTRVQSWIKTPKPCLAKARVELLSLGMKWKKGEYTVAKKLGKEKGTTF